MNRFYSRPRATTGVGNFAPLKIDIRPESIAGRCAALFAIEIFQESNKQVLKVSDSFGYNKRCDCSLSSEDLADLISKIAVCAEGLMYAQDRDVYKLAELGHYLFRTLIADVDIREFILECLNAEHSDIPLIIIHSPRLVIPWSFVYLQEPEPDKVDISQFLGYRCVVSCNIIEPEKAKNPAPPRIEGKVQVLGAYCDQLKYSKAVEIPFLRRVAARTQGMAQFVDFPPLTLSKINKASGQEDKKARAALFESSPAVVHFACHGSNNNATTENYIRVRKLYPLTNISLCSGNRDRFKLKPIVFLNVCEMGSVDPLKFTSLSGCFSMRGLEL